MRPILLAMLLGCGGPIAEAPLTIRLGIDHRNTEQALAAHQFCRERGQVDTSHELFPRCDRTNAELGDAWVTAVFEGDKLVELRRWERYADDARSVERWNELVTARSKTAAPLDSLGKTLPAGTRAVRAFRTDDGAVVGVFLVSPTPPENASVLELIAAPPAP